MTNLLAYRYEIECPIGSGGMGTVFRATDRLTGKVVAIKRGQLEKKNNTPDGAFRLALIQEFQILAVLRHPYIISVLDFGFDEHSDPFLVMEYISEAKNLLEASDGMSLQEKVGQLLLPTLQALLYLHRRGILHRDLKPANILISSDGLKVLDFGLASHLGTSTDAVGTFAYMAPEILQGISATRASDIFSFGILAAQLLGGAHPFGESDSNLISRLLAQHPNLAMVESAGLRTLILKLLEKDPANRPHTVDEIITSLCFEIGLPVPDENEALVENVLNSAPLTGREQEMQKLLGALYSLPEKGSLWLVGGESGVGKSRLLAELRIQALAHGTITLRGQGVPEGGLPFQLWRDSIKRLSLLYPLDTQEMQIMSALIPELPALHAEEIVRKKVALSPEQYMDAIMQIFTKIDQPVLILLEDLQWAQESLILLKRLTPLALEKGWMIVADYRDDETPNLPEALPDAQLILLKRLDKTAINELGKAILGEEKHSQELTDLLARETEGNVYFLVEIMRELARQAGRLSDVNLTTASSSVFPRSIQAIVDRRLKRLGLRSQNLLQMAALFGRQVDLRLFSKLASSEELQHWLTECANASILELQDGAWRFNHDKLRSGVVETIPTHERPDLHSVLGQALEALTESSPEYFAAAARHWELAGNTEVARGFYMHASDYAAQHASLVSARDLLGKVLSLTDETSYQERFGYFLRRQPIYHDLGDGESALENLHILEGLVEQQPDIVTAHWKVQVAWATYHDNYSDTDVALAHFQGLLNGELQDRPDMIDDYLRVSLILARYLSNLSRNAEALTWLEKARERITLRSPLNLQMEYYRIQGTLLHYGGKFEQALTFFEKAENAAEQIGDISKRALCKQAVAECLRHLNRYEEAKETILVALSHFRAIGFRRGEAVSLNTLANIYGQMGYYASGRWEFVKVRQIAQQIGLREYATYGQLNFLIYSYRIGDFNPDYRPLWDDMYESLKDLGVFRNLILVLGQKTNFHIWQGEIDLARGCANEAMCLYLEHPDPYARQYAYAAQLKLMDAECRFHEALNLYQQYFKESGEDVSGLEESDLSFYAYLLLKTGEQKQALEIVQGVVDKILNSKASFVDEDIFLPNLLCYRILSDAGNARSKTVLDVSVRELLKKRHLFGDEIEWQNYLHYVPTNRALLELAAPNY